MASIVNGGGERAFLRAQQLLRKEGALTRDDFKELDQLFAIVDGSQFMALTQDPLHQRALRDFDLHEGRVMKVVAVALAMTFLVSIFIGAFLTFFG